MTASLAPPAPLPAGLAERMEDVVGARHVIRDPAGLATYASDGLASYRVVPPLVVLPGSTEEVAAVVRFAAEAGIAVVARGAGTGLSGGALPVPGGVVVGLSRM